MKIPSTATIKTDKASFCFRSVEKLRLKMNDLAAQYKAGQMTEPVFRVHQRNIMKQIERAGRELRNHRLNSEDIAGDTSEKTTAMAAEENAGKKASKWDTDIELDTI